MESVVKILSSHQTQNRFVSTVKTKSSGIAEELQRVRDECLRTFGFRIFQSLQLYLFSIILLNIITTITAQVNL